MSAEADYDTIADYLATARKFRMAVRRPEEGDGGESLMMRLFDQHTAVADAAKRLGESRIVVASHLRSIEECAKRVWRDANYPLPADAPLGTHAEMEMAERPIWDVVIGCVEPATATHAKPVETVAVAEANATIIGNGAKPPRRRGCRLRIRAKTVLLDCEPVSLDMTTEAAAVARCFLAHLIRAQGDWLSSTEIDTAEKRLPGGGLAGQVWYRVRKGLPEPLRALVESNRRKGYRLSDAARGMTARSK
jgi:hypothetical protein